MKMRGYLLGTAILTAVPFAASAEDMYPRFTVYGGYSHAFADGDRNADDGIGFFVGAGVPLTRYLNVDFSAYHETFGGKDGGEDQRENSFKADFLFYYSRNRAFSPYVGIGAGYTKTAIDGIGDDTNPFFDAGVGFQTYPFRNSALGFVYDIRYRWLDNTLIGTSSKLEDVVVRAGLVVPFGVATAYRVVETAPTSKAEAEKRPEPVKMSVERRFADVLFDFDRSDIKPSFANNLDAAAKTINELGEQNAKVRVKVDGHTDWVGTDGYNMALGERRANAVKQYLIRKGVAADRIDTTSYGESKPVATNETAEGRALNRRAEVRTTAE
ncbi:OmpA family protein [Fontimonas sp. SYSU GA230001]|uniref:OmpA family protein n=1 Tax=Fontimonas sp. SYSU GA230001 TaxID=3142450 RepID=UPI0032B52071